MSTLIGSFDGLHDNRVLCYCADFEAHTLHMDTQTEAGEKVSVRFTVIPEGDIEEISDEVEKAISKEKKKRRKKK